MTDTFSKVLVVQADSFHGLYCQIDFGCTEEILADAFENVQCTEADLMSHSIVHVAAEQKLRPRTDLIEQPFPKVAYISQLLSQNPAALLLKILQLISRLDLLYLSLFEKIIV